MIKKQKQERETHRFLRDFPTEHHNSSTMYQANKEYKLHRVRMENIYSTNYCINLSKLSVIQLESSLRRSKNNPNRIRPSQAQQQRLP